MRYISLFSGIEAASVAWEQLGWEPVAFAEIEPFPCAVLRKRFPNVPNLGDVSKVDWSPYRGAVDVVVGGSPCQAFSIAGGRGGLLDPRGQLMLEFVRAVREIGPRFVLWENVPGVLSQDGGRAFGTLLRELEDCGLSCAWRVLDAQFVRVPVWGDNGEVVGWVGPVAQRRRRVFLVGHSRVGCAAAVLFESQGVCGDFASSREEREELARRSPTRVGAGGERGGCLTPWDVQSKRVFSGDSVSPTLNSGTHEGQNIQPCVMSFKRFAGSGARSMATYDDGTSCTLTNSDSHQPAVLAFAQNTRDEVRIQGDGTISGALSAQPGMKQTKYVVTSASANANGSDTHVDAAKTAGIRPPAIAFQTDHLSQNGTNVSYDVMKTLDTQTPPAVAIDYKQTPKFSDELCHTPTHDGDGGIHAAVGFTQNQRGEVRLCGGDGQTAGALSVMQSQQQTYVMSSGQANAEITDNGCSPTLTTIHEAPIVLDRAAFNQGQNAQFGFRAEESEVMDTFVSRGPNAVCVRRRYVENSNGENVVRCLCASDIHKVNSQIVNDGKIVLERVVADDGQSELDG
jgi:DNA (cytosine-5)-methyltransferase 1